MKSLAHRLKWWSQKRKNLMISRTHLRNPIHCQNPLGKTSHPSPYHLLTQTRSQSQATLHHLSRCHHHQLLTAASIRWRWKLGSTSWGGGLGQKLFMIHQLVWAILFKTQNKKLGKGHSSIHLFRLNVFNSKTQYSTSVPSGQATDGKCRNG